MRKTVITGLILLGLAVLAGEAAAQRYVRLSNGDSLYVKEKAYTDTAEYRRRKENYEFYLKAYDEYLSYYEQRKEGCEKAVAKYESLKEEGFECEAFSPYGDCDCEHFGDAAMDYMGFNGSRLETIDPLLRLFGLRVIDPDGNDVTGYHEEEVGAVANDIGDLFSKYEECYGLRPHSLKFTGKYEGTDECKSVMWYRPVFYLPPEPLEPDLEMPILVDYGKMHYHPRLLAASDDGEFMGCFSNSKNDSYRADSRFKLRKCEFLGLPESVQEKIPGHEAWLEILRGTDPCEDTREESVEGDAKNPYREIWFPLHIE